MENIELKQKLALIVEEFKDDDLFNYINENYGLEDLLSVEDIFFQKLNVQQSYSTNQAAQLLERELTYAKSKSQALVNYLQRPDFHKYLGQIKRNGRYRYDYRLLFKLRMIFYLSNQGLRPSDISEILGEIVSTEIYSNTRDNNESSPVERISNIKQEIMGELFELVEEEFSNKYNAFSDALTQRVKMQYKEDNLSLKSDTFELRKSMIERQKKILLQNKVVLESIANEKPKAGLFARLFGKEPSETNPTLLKGIENIDKELASIEEELVLITLDADEIKKQRETLSIEMENFKDSNKLSEVFKISLNGEDVIED